MTRARPRVAVLFNAPRHPPGHPLARSEAEVVDVAAAVAAALESGGFETTLLPAVPPAEALIAALRSARPALVFNLVEEFGGSSRGEAEVTDLLALLGIPFTGSPPETLHLCRSKAATKALLRGMGLPTAPFVVARPGFPLPPLGWAGPSIVKPESEDGSLGIDQKSIATSPSDLAECVERVGRAHGPRVLLEAYLSGPEYNVGVLALGEPKALPIAEVVFQPEPGTWPILTYQAKWDDGCAEDRASPVRCPAQIAPELASQLAALALAAFEATGCRDYARIDLRLNQTGEPLILEVNPNPTIHPQAGWARALAASGGDYSKTIQAIARQALGRLR